MRLHVVAAGEGPPVALLHGLFGQSRNLGALQRRLAGSYRTLALDLRNHGDSPHVPGMRYPAMAEDVLETLAARDALPAALIGHSMGGKTAMAAALARPEAVSRLLVADIAPVAYRHGNHHIAEALLALRPTPALTRAEADTALAGAVGDPGVRAFLLQNLRFGVEAGWRIGLREIADAIPDIEGWEAPPEGARYEGPALFVSGERSSYVLPESRPAIQALFPAARFVTVKGAGHWLHADNPEGFASIVEAFLAG